MYDVIFLGESINSPLLSSLQINPELLVSASGEIGDFKLRYREEKDQDIKEIKACNVIVNMDAEKEIPIDNENILTFYDQQDISEEDSIIFIQDYDKISPAIMSKIGLNKVIKLCEKNPDIQIYYFYRSMRFMDDNDQLFEKAREKGIVFLKYEKDNLNINEDNTVDYSREDINIKFTDNIIIAPDLKPSFGLERIARLFNIEKSPEGYLQTENIYLQPTLTGKRGVYVIGGSRGPTGYTNFDQDVEFTLNEIKANLEDIEPVVDDERIVDDKKCILCYNCYRICPHGAIEEDEELDAMKINNLACQGCNACISRCPAGAISIVGEEEKTYQGLRVMMCENSAEIAFEKYGRDKLENGEINIETIPCTGSIKKDEIFRYLNEPENKLLILGCFEESCKHINGDKRGEQVVNEVKETLKKLDIDDNRVTFKRLSPRMAEDVGNYLSRWKEGKL